MTNNIKLPALPKAQYLLGHIGGPYEEDRLTFMDGFSDDEMTAYAELSVVENQKRLQRKISQLQQQIEGLKESRDHFINEAVKATEKERTRCYNLCLRPEGWLSDEQAVVIDKIKKNIKNGT